MSEGIKRDPDEVQFPPEQLAEFDEIWRTEGPEGYGRAVAQAAPPLTPRQLGTIATAFASDDRSERVRHAMDRIIERDKGILDRLAEGPTGP